MNKELKNFKTKLLQSTKKDYFVYPTPLPPRSVDKLLGELSGNNNIQIGEDGFNGCDMDYSGDFLIDGVEFHYWGSAYEGSLVFQKIK